MNPVKNSCVFLCALLAALPAWCQPPSFSRGASAPVDTVVDMTFNLGLGGVHYEEDVDLTGAQSEWSAPMLSLEGEVAIDTGAWIFHISGTYWLTAEDTEEWSEGGELVQKNDMDVSGLTLLGEAGFPLSRGEDLTVTPFIGLGSRFINYDRSNFEILRRAFRFESTEVGSVEEDVDVFYLNGALELAQELGRGSRVDSRLDLGWVFSNQVDNDILSSQLDGDGGFIVRGELNWVQEIDAITEWGAGLFVDFQDLSGASASGRQSVSSGLAVPIDVEWPDNELLTYGVSLFWKRDL